MWTKVLEIPLVVAVCGYGSSIISSVQESLLGTDYSASMNRRLRFEYILMRDMTSLQFCLEIFI